MRILVVDDDKSTLIAMDYVLQTEGYLTTTAQNGRIALDIILANQAAPGSFSLIINDLQMPVMNGMELIEEVRKVGCKIPFLVMSGSIDRELESQLIQKGVEGYIKKPFFPGKVVRKVSEILSR